MSLKYIIGIDVGSYLTYVSVVKDGNVISIPTESGKRGFPTSVVFNNGMCLVGEAAEELSGGEVHIVNFKSMYKKTAKGTSFGIEPPVQEKYVGKFMGAMRTFKAQEIMAVVLAQAKNDAERFLGERIKGAVIAVPNYYHSEQRKAMMNAASIANLPVERLISDTSGLMLSKGLEFDGYHVVVDFGSTSFQLAVIAREAGVLRVLEETSCEVGGECLTQKVVENFAQLFKNFGFELTASCGYHSKLWKACERAKRDLDTTPEVFVKLLLFGRQVVYRIDQEIYETICQYELLEIFRLCSAAADHPHHGTYNGIIIAGRSAKSFKFLEVMKTIFPGTFIAAESFSVAHGAAKLHDGRCRGLKEYSHFTSMQ
ncbi:hypothetical protein DSO57_1015058 [Entomophthora muscae]|uniref:Uncharacterized protein n=1 Tax=Entomophthora muscae TaxID=34485 RepID=A0ACC2SI10_9FUNG|nr:hypothetical protein DSO57_1015058 [Entomophthora muscae]